MRNLNLGADDTDQNRPFSRRTRPAAVALLRLCAFLAADDIPISVLLEGARALPRELRRAAGDEVRIDRAVGALQHYALNDRQGDSLHVHRLVQAAVRDSLPGDVSERWLIAAVDLLGGAFPADATEPKWWPHCARLLTHAQVVLGVGGRSTSGASGHEQAADSSRELPPGAGRVCPRPASLGARPGNLTSGCRGPTILRLLPA